MGLEAAQGLLVMVPRAAEAKSTADHDRPVLARQCKVVHRLMVEARREAFAAGFLGAECEHVGGDVGAVDVQACAQEWDQEPSRPTSDIKGGFAIPLDELPEVIDLRAIRVELGPPACDETIVPDLGMVGHFLISHAQEGCQARCRCPPPPGASASRMAAKCWASWK